MKTKFATKKQMLEYVLRHGSITIENDVLLFTESDYSGLLEAYWVLEMDITKDTKLYRGSARMPFDKFILAVYVALYVGHRVLQQSAEEKMF